MAIRYFTENSPIPKQIKKRILNEWVKEIIDKHEKVLGDISFIFCNKKTIIKLNRDYLQHDYLTDILTFEYSVGTHLSGDLYICPEAVKSNSQKFKTNCTEELFRVMIHGVLHLCGINDKSEEEKLEMNTEENNALEILRTKLIF